MAYCPKCGKEITNTNGICPDCSQNNIGNPPVNNSDEKLKKILTIVAIVIIAGGGFFRGFSNIFPSSGNTSIGSTSSKVKDITDNPPIMSGLSLESYDASYDSNYLTVNGVIKTSFIARKGVYVNVTAYDKDKNKIDTVSASSSPLAVDEGWRFSVIIGSHDIAYYAITTVNYN